MSGFDRYDAIIIGGGHNGLVTAAYLARAGKKVCVLERRHVLGGCANTEELWPGYKVSTAAYVVSLLETQIMADLRLAENGLKILRRNPSSFTPLLDGRSLTLGPDMPANQKEIAQFSQADAEEYPRYCQQLERIAQVVEPLMQQPAFNPLPLSAGWRSRSLPAKVKDSARLFGLYQALSELGDDLPDAMDLLMGAARPVLENRFESEVLRATLGTDAIIGSFQSLSSPGSAYVLLHHVMGKAGGERGVWGYVQGGMGTLSDALASVCQSLSVDIYRESEVRRVLVEEGVVVGVTLEDGRLIEAPIVASSVDANLTFNRLVKAGDLPETFMRAVNRIDYSSASMKINLALSEIPQFTCRKSDGVGPHHHGTIHISPTMGYIERAYADAVAGWPSTEPVLEITIPSSVDSSIVPEGKHLMNVFVQFAPYALSEGKHWDDIKEDFADRCIQLLARYAPNVPDSIEHRQVLSPLDLEREFGLTGGNIMQGAMSPNQLFFNRPVTGWADHRTPLVGLYLCGAASHPGGGVMGTCGRNAAAAILKDH
ncbi:MAG: amine oxidase [Rhodopirellula sp.]|jgi:phytoene dehydrogenase-like protein|nr:amine oxidase [Rhodopirellula sp.]|tara:strand:- start:1162 stop:2787 length:1626 start_codon:yes stop_codon:yes gene_type:complete